MSQPPSQSPSSPPPFPEGSAYPPQQPPYSPASAPWVVVPSQPKGFSVASMVLGLCSIFLGWTFIAPCIGLILGIVGLRREPAGKGMAVTGVILNGIMLLGWVVLVLMVVSVGMMGVMSGSSVSAHSLTQ